MHAVWVYRQTGRDGSPVNVPELWGDFTFSAFGVDFRVVWRDGGYLAVCTCEEGFLITIPPRQRLRCLVPGSTPLRDDLAQRPWERGNEDSEMFARGSLTVHGRTACRLEMRPEMCPAE